MTSRLSVPTRPLLLVLALPLALVLATAPAPAPAARAQGAIEQPTLEAAVVRDPQLGAQFAIADAYGYFKDEGLNLTVRWLQSGADVITLMAGGSQNIGTGGTFSQVVFGGQKLPIRTIADLADISGTQGFALSPGVKLASPKELEGKKIAHTQGNSQILILAKLAKVYGFDMRKVTLVNMQPSEAVVAASKGDVQGMLGWQPNLYRLVKLGGTMYTTGSVSSVTGKPVTLPASDKMLYNDAVLLASDAWIRDKPNTLKAVMRALLRANDLIVKDPKKALDALEKELRIDREALGVMVGQNVYGMAITDEVAHSIEFQSDWAMSIKRIPHPVKAADVLAPKLLAEIDPKLVTWKK